MEMSTGSLFCLVLSTIGVQGITMFVHLPLNNSLQGVDINELDLKYLKQLRSEFETRWNYFNNIRTSIALALIHI